MARVLVADDEAPMREMLRMALELDGHEVHEAIDASTAIGLYGQVVPELLILDLNMPGGGGESVIKQLHAAGQRICPTVIVTGYIAELSPEMRAVMPRYRVVEKPFQLGSFQLAIREVLFGVL